MLTITLVKIISLSVCSSFLKFNSPSVDIRGRTSINLSSTELGHKKHKEIYLKTVRTHLLKLLTMQG